MDLQDLEALQQRAFEIASQSGQIADVEKAVSIAKQVVDARKAATDSINQPKLLRYEEWKAWAALLVPFLSIATLAVTIIIQAAQLKATREASENTEWSETLKNVLSQLSRPATVTANPALAMSLLEPYTYNKRFGPNAKLLAIHLLATTPSTERFQDFFLSHHIGESWSDIHFLTDVNRELNGLLAEVNNRLKFPSKREILNAARETPEILNAAREATIYNITFLTEKICSLYRANSTFAVSADFRDVFLMDGNLSGLKFTSADLTGASFQNIDFNDVSFGDAIKFNGTEFIDSHWWDAREIAKPLLKLLIENHYPYFDNERVSYTVVPPDKQVYFEKVQHLCQKVNLSCEPSTLKYGDAPKPTQVSPVNAQTITDTTMQH